MGFGVKNSTVGSVGCWGRRPAEAKVNMFMAQR